MSTDSFPVLPDLSGFPSDRVAMNADRVLKWDGFMPIFPDLVSILGGFIPM